MEGRNTKSTDRMGLSVTYTYDKVGNLLKQTDARGNVTSYTYDRNYNLLTVTSLTGTNFIDMPSKITVFSPKQVAELAQNSGWTVEPLGKGSLKGIPYEQGDGISMHGPNESSLYIQYHPSGRHHGEMSYFKVSSGKKGIRRFYINGIEVCD